MQHNQCGGNAFQINTRLGVIRALNMIQLWLLSTQIPIMEVVSKQSRFSSAVFFLPCTLIGPLPAEAIGLHEPSRELLLCLLFVGPAFSLLLFRVDETNRTPFLHEIASSRFRDSSCKWADGERLRNSSSVRRFWVRYKDIYSKKTQDVHAAHFQLRSASWRMRLVGL
jgi:hypothetical protein